MAKRTIIMGPTTITVCRNGNRFQADGFASRGDDTRRVKYRNLDRHRPASDADENRGKKAKKRQKTRRDQTDGSTIVASSGHKNLQCLPRLFEWIQIRRSNLLKQSHWAILSESARAAMLGFVYKLIQLCPAHGAR